MRVEGIGEIRNVVGRGAARCPRSRRRGRGRERASAPERRQAEGGCRGSGRLGVRPLAASTASVRSHSCSGSRRCTGCHHIALWMGVASNGGSYTHAARAPGVLGEAGLDEPQPVGARR